MDLGKWLNGILVTFFVAVIKYPNFFKINLRKEGCILGHSLMIQSILMEKLWQQKLDRDDHIESSQEVELDECLVSACFLLFIQSSIPAQGMVMPTVSNSLIQLT